MTREQYLFLLRAELDGLLSEEEIEEIIQYYSEYFEEAGPEQERDVMLELGSPQRLAEKILEQRRLEEAFDASDGYTPMGGGYGGADEQGFRWVAALLLGVAALVAIPTVGGLVLGFGLGGIGCMLGGGIAVVVGCLVPSLAGKLYVTGGGLVAFAVGLVLFVAAAGMLRITVHVMRHCWEQLTGGGAVYHEAGY